MTAPEQVRRGGAAPSLDEAAPDADVAAKQQPPPGSVLTRRGVLGALAAGTVIVACGGDDGALDGLQPPVTTGLSGSGSNPGSLTGNVQSIGSDATVPPTATGPELETFVPPSAPGLPTAASDAAAPAVPSPAGPKPADDGGTTATTAPAVALPVTSTAPGETAADPGRRTTTTNVGSATTATVPFRPAPDGLTAATLAAKITFGPTPTLIAEIEAMGPGTYLEDQLRRTGPDQDVERRLSLPLLGRNAAGVLAYIRDRNLNANRDIEPTVSLANMYRAVNSRSQLYEMMVELWSDHFNVAPGGGGQWALVLDYQENRIRPNAMGTFRELLKATAHGAAMLNYLDNAVSNANDPEGVNENYGRELLELHTLGIDATGKQIYNQTDVENTARIMTGWSAELRTRYKEYGEFVYRGNYEYTGELSILGGAFTTTGRSGKARGDALLDFLATHPSTASYVAYKICRRFVSETPPAALVASAARVYLANDTQIVPVLRHVFASAAFAASANHKARRPREYLAAALRFTGATVPRERNRDAERALLGGFLSATGHRPWGWPTPDGYPEEAAQWISAASLMTRWNFAGNLARGRVKNVPVDLGPLRARSGTARDHVIDLASRLGMSSPSTDLVDATLAAAGVTAASSASSLDDEQLATIVGLLLSAPLFQTR